MSERRNNQRSRRSDPPRRRRRSPQDRHRCTRSFLDLPQADDIGVDVKHSSCHLRVLDVSGKSDDSTLLAPASVPDIEHPPLSENVLAFRVRESSAVYALKDVGLRGHGISDVLHFLAVREKSGLGDVLIAIFKLFHALFSFAALIRLISR